MIHDDGDLLVVDKPSGVPVHGGDEALGDDLVHRLAAWLRARGEGEYLGVHQRLDKGTSGVLAFTRSTALNAALSRDIESHRAERTYVAGVTFGQRARVAASGRLEHYLIARHGEPTRVLAQPAPGAKQAITDYRVLERRGQRALIELSPKTGRTHQLRAQLAQLGAPIAGDTLYGGSRAARLMLHARRLHLPGIGGSYDAAVPRELSAWLAGDDAELGSSAELEQRVIDAACRRWPLSGRSSAYRLINGDGDLLPGITVDVYAGYAVFAVSSAEANERRLEIADCLRRLGLHGVYFKARTRADLRHQTREDVAPSEPIAGSAADTEIVVHEGDARFWVALADGLSTGLFVDQRDNRARVRALSTGRRVLNLFAYTCSFSVAAALGGAESTLSVDLSGRALSRGRKNFDLNGIEGAHRFLKEDALAWLERARRRGDRFDLIVLDPPSFATIGKSTFSVEKGYGSLAQSAIALLDAGGQLLAVTNHRKTSQAELRRTLIAAAAGAQRRVQACKELGAGLDCPDGAAGPEPSKSALLTVD